MALEEVVLLMMVREAQVVHLMVVRAVEAGARNLFEKLQHLG